MVLQFPVTCNCKMPGVIWIVIEFLFRYTYCAFEPNDTRPSVLG